MILHAHDLFLQALTLSSNTVCSWKILFCEWIDSTATDTYGYNSNKIHTQEFRSKTVPCSAGESAITRALQLDIVQFLLRYSNQVSQVWELVFNLFNSWIWTNHDSMRIRYIPAYVTTSLRSRFCENESCTRGKISALLPTVGIPECWLSILWEMVSRVVQTHTAHSCRNIIRTEKPKFFSELCERHVNVLFIYNAKVSQGGLYHVDLHYRT